MKEIVTNEKKIRKLGKILKLSLNTFKFAKCDDIHYTVKSLKFLANGI